MLHFLALKRIPQLWPHLCSASRSSWNCIWIVSYHFDNSVQSVIQETLKHIDSKHIFSLCHINIRSLKANLPALENCLDVMDFDFSIIGVSETRLHDWNCDLYNIEGYHFVESHRPVRTGGGVGIYLKRDIPFQHRTDLIIHNGLCEYIFVEIEKKIFQQSKKYCYRSHLSPTCNWFEGIQWSYAWFIKCN